MKKNMKKNMQNNMKKKMHKKMKQTKTPKKDVPNYTLWIITKHD